MADLLQFDLVSPERQLASGKASAVLLPGAEGDLTALVDHAPVITMLRAGIVKVSSPEGDAQYVVTGGFAEIGPGGTTVLAERAVTKDELTQAVFDDFVAAAIHARDNATPELLSQLAKQVADIAAVASELGLQTNLG